MSLQPRRRHIRRVALLIALVLTGTSVACDRDAADSPTPTSTPVASPSQDEAQARRDVKAAYDGWYDTFVDAVTSGTYRREDFAKYVTEPRLSAALKDLKDINDLNVIYRGRPSWDTQVTSLSLDSTPPTAALRVCLDISKSTPVDKTTGESLKPKDELPRFVITASAKRLDGTWYVADSTTQRTTPC